VADPVKLVQNILVWKSLCRKKFNKYVRLEFVSPQNDIESTGTHKCRNILRFTPIEMTCKAFETQISETLKVLLEPHYSNNENPVGLAYFIVIIFLKRVNSYVSALLRFGQQKPPSQYHFKISVN